MAKATENKKKYVVTINNVSGVCDSPIFEKMAKKGDITSESVKEHIGDVITINGLADAHIETSEKEYDLMYMSTDIGFIHTGSTVFRDSVTDYYPDVRKFRLTSIKTKNGTAYKPVPILETETEDSNEWLSE